ncbi:DUF4917 family protein, partial [Candidatus Micrarchaeota archaeon]|nr:DUF4917 family protein [Candidatus Micrarchaeota archaeon]
MTYPICLWDQLPPVSWDALLLGNGASIALDTQFDYRSLHQLAQSEDRLPTSGPLFRMLGTTDFEHVLLACWHAYLVNLMIPPSSPNIAAVYQEVRDALIGAVQQVHPDPATLTNDLGRIGVFASQFKTIVTFNYDITLYWAMQEYNNNKKMTWFKDAFRDGVFQSDWQTYRQPYGCATGATLVFYAHGSLALARDVYGSETKLTASPWAPGAQSPLLNNIVDSWRVGTHVPLFVSEGNSDAKLASIRRSFYLRTVYDQILSSLDGNVVVYGLSFSDNDRHIIRALKNC